MDFDGITAAEIYKVEAKLVRRDARRRWPFREARQRRDRSLASALSAVLELLAR
jgi:hypothetical protein